MERKIPQVNSTSHTQFMLLEYNPHPLSEGVPTHMVILFLYYMNIRPWPSWFPRVVEWMLMSMNSTNHLTHIGYTSKNPGNNGLYFNISIKNAAVGIAKQMFMFICRIGQREFFVTNTITTIDKINSYRPRLDTYLQHANKDTNAQHNHQRQLLSLAWQMSI